MSKWTTFMQTWIFEERVMLRAYQDWLKLVNDLIKMLRVYRDWIKFSSQQALEVLTHVEFLASTLYSSAFNTWANLLRSLCFALL